ncbi:hypothetical protein BDV36DRAFT_254963 [Aspergillus pseudocaelatus]|uniref:Uncharacterized protein n=1 Tax=Aspergillus pseudocaelatus TaxID=1825620 RepID=A0ABQ6WLY8_9EURO|nr:hypothetical protein BDV36DRAFT_254963 [Aspergillus pseudocaelatus]
MHLLIHPTIYLVRQPRSRSLKGARPKRNTRWNISRALRLVSWSMVGVFLSRSLRARQGMNRPVYWSAFSLTYPRILR